MLPLSFQPGPFTVLKDYICRAIKGELHLPPWWLRDVGGSDFKATGEEFLQLFIQLGNLHPCEYVLEIGCGSGRMAIPLTNYLDHAGIYVGMDITRSSIVWCQQHISRYYPNFYFFHVDLYNERYNPKGSYQAQDYSFPFKDRSFDFIFLASVFTHLLPEDTTHYLSQVARMLNNDGRALFTFFLLNNEQQHLAEQGLNDINFKYKLGNCRIRDLETPESAVAYNEIYLHNLLSQCGLTLQQPIHYGSWSGRGDGLSYQDILIVHPIG
jgi:SAM-dependent methyltransferase